MRSSARAAARRALIPTTLAGAIAVAATASWTTAEASRCPYGQILRVKMDKCVAWGSALALAYEGPRRSFPRGRLKRIAMELPPLDRPRETVAAEDPAIEVLRERLKRGDARGPPSPTDILLSLAAKLEWPQ